MSVLSLMRKVVHDDFARFIDVVHSRVHEGKTFFASYKTPSTVADNGTLIFLFKTGSVDCHMTYIVAGGGDISFEGYEDSTLSGEGTLVPLYCLNRTSGLYYPKAVVKHTPTVSALGSKKLIDLYIPGGRLASTSGGIMRSGTEWVGKPNTNYVGVITNLAGQARRLGFAMEWYEWVD